MIPGLNEKENQFIFEHLINPLKSKGFNVYLFGSRAKGTHQKFSDIDLLYSAPAPKPPHLTNEELYKILSFLEESSFTYKIDLVYEPELAASYKPRILAEKILL